MQVYIWISGTQYEGLGIRRCSHTHRFHRLLGRRCHTSCSLQPTMLFVIAVEVSQGGFRLEGA